MGGGGGGIRNLGTCVTIVDIVRLVVAQEIRLAKKKVTSAGMGSSALLTFLTPVHGNELTSQLRGQLAARLVVSALNIISIVPTAARHARNRIGAGTATVVGNIAAFGANRHAISSPNVPAR